MIPRLCCYTLLLLPTLVPFQTAQATLEVSLTISGEISEIQDVLAYIEERNRQQRESGNAMKINFHSTAGGEAVEAGPPPARLAVPQLAEGKLTPGRSALITVAVRDENRDVDTLAVHVVGTNLKSDLYDDGSHGDVKPGDGIWSTTLTPMEATPAGTYELIVTGFDANGLGLRVPGADGDEVPLEVRTEVTIER